MKIIIVRHGETVGNNLGITQGQNHGKLSKLGLKQVEKLANYLKNEKIDSVYCSDLNRCKESIIPLLRIIKINVNYTPLLRERGKGIFEGKPRKELIDWSKDNLGKVPEGGESREDVDIRAKIFLDKNMKNWKNKTVLIMTHGQTKLSLLNCLLVINIENQKFIEEMAPNASISIVEIDKDKNLFISKLHYTKHLGELNES